MTLIKIKNRLDLKLLKGSSKKKKKIGSIPLENTGEITPSALRNIRDKDDTFAYSQTWKTTIWVLQLPFQTYFWSFKRAGWKCKCLFNYLMHILSWAFQGVLFSNPDEVLENTKPEFLQIQTLKARPIFSPHTATLQTLYLKICRTRWLFLIFTKFLT